MTEIGRNDPCPCGSGKKYKKCCLGKMDKATSAENSRQAQVAMAQNTKVVTPGYDFEEYGRLGIGTSFTYFKIMSEALGKDTRRCMDVCLSLKKSMPADQPIDSPTYDELSFWYRNLIRAFVSEVEGLLFVMRRIIIWSDERQELHLSSAEATLVREADYRMDVRRKRIEERDRPNRLLENFVLSFSLFPKVFGSNFEVDYGDHGWEAFQKIISARNRITHPKSPQDTLLGADIPNTLAEAAPWFYGSVSGFLGAVDPQALDKSMRSVSMSPAAQALLKRWSGKGAETQG